MRTIKALAVLVVMAAALGCTKPAPPLTPHTTPSQSLAEVCNVDGMGTWHDLPPLPEARGYISAVRLDNWIYAIGGVTTTDNTNTPEDDHLKFPHPRAPIYRYDVNAGLGGSWEKVTELPTSVAGAGAVVFQGKIYVIGGYTGEEDTYHKVNLVQVYDPESNTWSSGPPMKEARAWGVAILLDQQVYMVGGVSKGYYSDTVESLDLSTNGATWQIAGKVLEPRYFLGAVPYQDNILVVGGDRWIDNPKPGEKPNPQSDLIEVFDRTTRKSTRVGTLNPPTSAIVGVAGTQIFYIQGHLWRAVPDASGKITLIEVAKIPASDWDADKVYHGLTGLGAAATVNGIVFLGGGGSGAPTRNAKFVCML